MSSEEPSSSSVPPGPRKKKRKFSARIPPCRVKRVMQIDEDIGRMTASVPVVLGRTMEHFAERLLLQSAAVVQNSESRTLNLRHMKEAISRNPKEFSILNSLIEGIVERKESNSSSTSTTASSSREKTEPGTFKKRRASADVNGRKKKKEKAREDDWDDEGSGPNGSQEETSDSASSGIQTLAATFPMCSTTLSSNKPLLPSPAAPPSSSSLPSPAAPVSVIIKYESGSPTEMLEKIF